MINIPKGTKDILPEQSYKWRIITENAYKVADKFNIKEIKTPMFEHTELFVRSAGTGSDVVNKEMYTFLDKGERSITLKPEGTAGVVRSFIENGLFNNALPLKVFYITNCFRYERPQAGRLRQHTQFGVEMFGPNDYLSDLEIISIAKDFYARLGLNPTVYINNLGCEECRKKYVEKLREFLKQNLENLCPDCQVRYQNNPLRALDCKVKECKEILKNAPLISECLCDDCNEKFTNLTQGLDIMGINYKLDPRLVRGLDYYTNFVFEFVADDFDGGVVGGGGRFNNLVKELGDKDVPVIGFGTGIERVLNYVEGMKIDLKDNSKVDIYVANLTDNKKEILQLVHYLRDEDYVVEYDLMGRSLKAQFKYADKLGARFVITLGDDEINNKMLTIKDMFTGEQSQIRDNEIRKFLKDRRNG